MSEKDIALRKYLSDNKRFADLVNGIAFDGKEIICVDEVEEQNPVSVNRKNGKMIRRERDIIKKVKYGSGILYIACENQMEIHYAMPVRTMLYNAITYDEQFQKLKLEHKEKKDWENSTEFLSGMKENDKLMAVVTFICYYGREEWNTNVSLKDMILIPEKYHQIESYLMDYRLNLIPMMKINPNVFHGELRELIALLQCNSDIHKIEQLILSDIRYRYLSEETFEVFMVLSDEKASLKKLKEHVILNRERREMYDMCRAFEQLEERGEKRAEKRLNGLYTFLISEERYDDLKKAMVNEEFRKELYKEIQLV